MTKGTGKRIVSKRGASVAERLTLHSKPVGSCLIWTGARDGRGYGKINVKGKYVQAHRAAWACHVGEIEGGLMVMHSCDTPLCINPAHLSLGSHSDNMVDMRNKGRQSRGELHPAAKLIADDVRSILAMVGSTCRAVGEHYSVSPMTVSLIRRRKLWAHLDTKDMQ